MDLAQQDLVYLEKLKADPTAITLAKLVAEGDYRSRLE
jgi:hypothetical protein